MHIGPFIKLHRIEQDMTQEELAAGIVSMSYLSKIENQHTNASIEVIDMLCKRLKVEPLKENEEALQDMCRSWYSMLFEVNDKEEITHLYKKINRQMGTAITDGYLMFQIHVIRYFLVIGSYKKALQQINKLTEVEDAFDHIHEYYWYKFKGNCKSLHNDFNQAMRMYKLAEERGSHLSLSKSEKADLEYTVAVTHSKLRNTLETIKYAETALEVYREKYEFIRCAQCHLLLGISYRRIRMNEKAIENYNLAKHLGELNNSSQVIQLANQNLGYLYATNGDVSGAIRHYEEVVTDQDIDLNARLPAITSLIREYYSISNIDKTREMIEQGLQIIDKQKNSKTYKLYYYIIHTYKYVLDEEMDKFETMVIQHFLPYLQKHKDYVNIVVYTTMLATYYEKLHKYKDAVFYYKEASIAYEELTNI